MRFVTVILRRAGWGVLAPLSLLVLAACGGDAPGDVGVGPPPTDSGACAPGELTLPTSAGGSCQPAGLPPPMPCPAGERALADGTCQPAGVPPEACAVGRFVPDGRGGCEAILPEEACPPGQMAVPGETACREVAPCGDGPWGDIPVDGTTQFVDAGYMGSDSDGSREKPWRTVGEGVRAASAGAIVAVAEGSYREDVVVAGKPARLWGRCPALTEVVGAGTQQGAITIARSGASGSEVRGLAVTGPSVGLFVERARSVVLDEVWVHEAGRFGVVAADHAGVTVRGALLEHNGAVGVFVESSEATVEATVVRGTQADGAGHFGRGISAQRDLATNEAGTLRVVGSLVDENHESGVLVEGVEATIEATVVRATQPNGTGKGALGIGVQPDPATGEVGKLLLAASLLEDNHGFGMAILGAEATIEATVVRATQPYGVKAGGRGINVQVNPRTGEGGKLWLTSSLVEANHEHGVFVEGAEATIEATVVRATQPDGAGRGGRGIGAQPSLGTGTGAKLSLTASVVEENREFGITVAGVEATVEATVVRATQPNGDGKGGLGINIEPYLETGERGKLLLTTSLVEENHATGVMVSGSEATVEATTVRTTQPNGAEGGGLGVVVESNRETGERGKLLLTTSLVEENHEIGVMIFGSEATVEATVVRATQPDGGEVLGRGIEIQPDPMTGDGGRLELRASLIAENHEGGVMIFGAEATVDATVVRATQPNDAGKGGQGISVLPDPATRTSGKLSLTASLVEENRQIGVLVGSSEATIAATVVRATKLGLADPGFGDGILVMDDLGQSRVTIVETESTDNARAGVLYVGSTGELSSVRSSGNRFGLVLQPGMTGAQPTLGDDNLFEGNIETDELVGGDLPVPDTSAQLP